MTDPNYTHLALVADRSGSMQSIKHDMNDGLTALMEEQAKLDGKLLVDVTVFDDKIDVLYQGVDVSEVKGPFILPRGMTALYDGIGHAVTSLGERLAALPEEERPHKVVVVVVTDGQENSSREWTQEKLKELIKTQTDEFQWEFLFLGANIDSATVGGGFGVKSAQTLNYVATAQGAAFATRSMSTYMTSTRSGIDTTLEEESSK